MNHSIYWLNRIKVRAAFGFIANRQTDTTEDFILYVVTVMIMDMYFFPPGRR